MKGLAEFLRERWVAGGFSTEDVLASFLPLARQVLAAHQAGFVAPLEGIDDLHVEGVRIWFEEARRRPLKPAPEVVQQLESQGRAAMEVVAMLQVTTNVDEGREQLVDLTVGDGESPVVRPVYLPGYRGWEHALGCHDPLTDIFSLGLILASLACGMDLGDRATLEEFAAHRKNLFRLAPQLHPVLARAIVRMTELSRQGRSQDLAALVHSLENYRDQEVDFEYDLAQTVDFAARPKRDKQTVVLTKLRERLFEISRRNRLLHFRATLQSVNLTQASVPLSFHIESIRPDQILTWNDEFQKQMAAGKDVSLNRFLNFSEQLYLPGQLDKLIADARRDQAEFGFAQLRLVACFLHWANLKEKPVEQFDSPLILLPVVLKKKKGIRDTYYLEALQSEAEVNPVVRHQFQQLYGIELPEFIDLQTTSIEDFYQSLAARIEASEAAVTLVKIDRPRIAVIQEKARRRLDQYRRRARLAGRGVRKFQDLDYSYDPVNFHPLGITLFNTRVRPPATNLRAILDEKPRPRSFLSAANPEELEPGVVEAERTLYSLQQSGEGNPYEWTFDLCSVTLANFKYRRMSLVRDYEALLSQESENPAFEAVFSLAPRSVERADLQPHPLHRRFDVVPCDPTQAEAIAESSRGTSYIIQGPPGTGKSQTITNLIADYVANGKRVLFVCEKRAAIDVVYARLRQCGLGDLCCLIHDSQTDKKGFVLDLKQTYEFLLTAASSGNLEEDGRDPLLRKLEADLEPLQRFDAAMRAAPPEAGVSVRELLERCIALQDQLPELDPLVKERLPDYAEWHGHRSALQRFEQSLKEVVQPPVLARHALRILSTRLLDEERPLEQLSVHATAAREGLRQLGERLTAAGVSPECWETLRRAHELTEYACRMLPLVELGHFQLLDRESQHAKWFTSQRKNLGELQQAVEEATESARNWRDKLTREETDLAYEQAQAFERSWLAWLRPSWWRLRSVLQRSYDFGAHKVRPSWTRVLEWLRQEHQATAARNKQLVAAAERLEISSLDVDPLAQHLLDAQNWLPGQPDWLSDLHSKLLKQPESGERIDRCAALLPELERLQQHLQAICDEFESLPLSELGAALEELLRDLERVPDYLDCLEALSSVPSRVSAAYRSLPLLPTQIEAAMADHSLQKALRHDKTVDRFSHRTRERHVSKLERGYEQWLRLNAAEVSRRVNQRFLANVQLSSQPAGKLSDDEKELKRAYSRGRRELEHEFGKSMRYKAIRDLVAGETGEVVKDLKPVWLMSPLSVSDTLPLDAQRFDVVIFDEASQITLEEAVPALFRAPQSIIVGDEMQLPPTDFFSSKQSSEEDEDLLVETDGELVQYDLDSGSFLNHAAKNLPSTMLGWHYRSRSESLISFSNWAFYDGRLLTVPEESLAARDRAEIVAQSPSDGVAGAAELLERPISFHYVASGVYEQRRNRAEAEYIAEMVRTLLLSESGLTVGIVAFSEAQQDEIEQALNRLAEDDKAFQARLETELEREDDRQFVGLLVKNLENIQGDERDVIILSICYGHAPDGKLRMNFGPINKSGGEKRLNVAFSRAKQRMAVVSSIRGTEITNDYNTGANCLKNYLRYAEAVSSGDTESARRIVEGLSRWSSDERGDRGATADVVAEQLAAALSERGYRVRRSVGQSHFRCDLAVHREGDDRFRLGVLIDNQRYYEQSDLLERDLLRPRLLRAFGWNITHVLAKDWYYDSSGELQRVLELLEADG